jgi:hypothetical protein
VAWSAWPAVALVGSCELHVRTAPLRQGLYTDGSVIRKEKSGAASKQVA